jgi:exodeoxyribonuclease VII small subunit
MLVNMGAFSKGSALPRQRGSCGIGPAVARLPHLPHSSRMTEEQDVAELSFEQALKELEQIVGRLETGEEELDKAIQLYERGDKLRQLCAQRLDAAQERIEAIRLGADGRPTGTAPFAAS